MNNERAISKNGGAAENKQITHAKAFIPVALANGPRMARDLYAEALKLGISDATMKSAKRQLGNVIVTQVSKGWEWKLRDTTVTDTTVEMPEDVL